MHTPGGREAGIAPARWVGQGLWLLAWFALVALATRTVVGDETSPVWKTDFKAALQEAEERKLPLLVHFYADWCMPCQRMEREVLHSPTVKELLGQRYVAVKVNSDRSQDLVRRYGVETLPSDVVVDSLTGRVLSLNSGFQDQARYLTRATQAEAKFLKVHAANLKASPGTADAVAADSATNATSGDGKAELGEPQPVVGLDGFSPVSMAKHRRWTRGSARYAWDYKGITYYMASREELVEFRSSPESFAPKLLGCDPVILWETDRAVAGDIQYGAFFDDELYLFKTEARRKQFKSKPEKYIRLQHAVKVEQIERTILR